MSFLYLIIYSCLRKKFFSCMSFQSFLYLNLIDYGFNNFFFRFHRAIHDRIIFFFCCSFLILSVVTHPYSLDNVITKAVQWCEVEIKMMIIIYRFFLLEIFFLLHIALKVFKLQFLSDFFLNFRAKFLIQLYCGFFFQIAQQILSNSSS